MSTCLIKILIIYRCSYDLLVNQQLDIQLLLTQLTFFEVMLTLSFVIAASWVFSGLLEHSISTSFTEAGIFKITIPSPKPLPEISHKPIIPDINTESSNKEKETGSNNNCTAETPLKHDKDKPHLLLPVITSCNTLLIILSLFFNLFILTYYWTNSTNLPSILYLRNSVADFISAIGFLLQVPLVMRVLEEDVPTTLPLISYWITTVSVRMSVFMNCVLGVVRCINILNPFYPVNRKYVTISTLVYLLLWSTITSLDIWTYIKKIGLENKVYLIKSLVLKAEPGFSLTSLTGSTNSTLISFSQGEIVVVQFLVPVVLPALLCFVLMTIQIYYLTRQKVGITSNQPGAGKKSTQLSKVSSEEQRTEKRKKLSPNRKAAVTILIVTTIYVLTSILSVAVWLIIYRAHLGREDKIKKLSWTELGMIYISSSTSPLLCSTVTALALFLRSCAMQRHLKVVFGKLFKPQTSLELSMRTEESR